MGRGDLDGARTALRPVLELSADRRPSGITTITLRVHVALRDPRYYGTPAAREMQEEYEE
jgi:hypothetical protein